MTEPEEPIPASGPGSPAAAINIPGFIPENDPRAVTRFEAVGFFVADFAAVESGKVYASGGFWTQLRFPAFPATLPMCALVAVIRVPWHANNQDHEFHFRLENSDRQRLPFDVGGQFRGAAGPEMKYGESGVMQVAVPIPGLPFQAPGSYAFTLEIDGVELARYPFEVLQVVMPGMPIMSPPPGA